MRANNPSFKVNKVSHSHKLPTKFVSTVPKFHSEAINPNNNTNNVNVNVNRFSLFPPSQSPYKISPAKLHIFTPKDEFDKNFQEKKEQPNAIDQTNLQGKRSSEPPSGHSYGSSKKSYGDYAADDESPSKSASSSSSSSSSGYQTSGVGYGGTNKDPRATGETSNAGGVSGGVGRSDGGGASGAAGSPSSSASSSGLGGASTGKQTGSETKWPPQGTTHSQSSWPPPSQATSGDPWIQSGHSTGTDWSPEKTAEKTGKDKEGKHAQDKSSSEHTSRRSKSEGKATDHKDSKLTDSINDPLQQSYSDSSFPEVTTKESMDSSTQRTAEDMISLKRARGEKDIKEGGVESQYSQRQFNNAFEDLSKVSPGSTEGVIDSARKALDTINSPSGLFSGMNQSDRDKDKWQEKSNNKESSTQRAKGEKDINEGEDQHQFNNTFENLSKTAPESSDVVRDAARKAVDTINSQSSGLYAGMNQSDRDKDKWQEKSYNTLPKEGAKNKDTGIDLKGDKGQTSTSASMDQSLGHKEGKEYENQVKGLEHKDETFYADNLGKKSTIKGDPYSALDTSSKDYEHRVKGTNYRDIEDSTVETVKKDTYDAMGKAKDTYNQVEGSVKGAFNQAKDTFNQAEGTVADKAKNAFNQVEGTVKGAYDTVVDKAKNIYENVSEKTTGMKDDLERKARDVVYDNVKQQAYNTVTDKARDTYNQVEGTYNQAKDAFNQAEGTVADKAKSAYNQVEGQVKGAFNQAKDTTNEFINDVTAGQRTVTNERGEQRVVTGDDVKQDRGSSQRMDEGQGMNIQSVASNIVHKVIETAENVKEKVGNILHGVTGTTTDNTTNERDATRRDTEREGVSGRGTTYSRPDPNEFSNRPASEASGAKDENMYEKDREQKRRTDSQRHHHPDHDNNVGHASS